MATTAPPTRAQALLERIESSIVERGLTRGDALGTLEHWRAESGFARATVSEAVRILVDRGAVEIRPGRGGGIFVAEVGPVVRLRHTLLSVHGEASTVADAIAIREALEPLLVEDATRHRSARQLRGLTRALEALAAARGDRDEFLRANWELHVAIAGITPNEMLSAVYLTMLGIINERSESATGQPGEDEAAYIGHRIAVHRELVAAIAEGDVQRARLAVLAHAAEPTAGE
ncbi:FadR/GntR family transcriptional regulator [Marisediminicola senii]|uniref:FadR/GntR family transcriptional regulator n=1 Tax=Marisediminicola senii TaxID=2711233 RepID=UPI001912E6E1|nr:FCD domain-containing protein [Marisediminicola senii]